MDADRPLKELFRLRPRDLLALTGDGGAVLVSSQVVELASLSRRADTVLQLRRGRQSYIRHLEFEVQYRLQALSRRRYTARELAGVIPREMIMASSLWAEAVNKGRREGRAEGAVEDARAFCAELTRELHPDVADRILPMVKACSDVERLHAWGLQASKLSDPEFLHLVTEKSSSTSGPARRGRTPRPSRAAKGSG